MEKINVKLKTQLTRDEIKDICDAYQAMKNVCDEYREMFDTSVSNVRKLDDMAHKLRNMFDFRPRKNESGEPCHYTSSVLPDDEKAWYYKEGE